MNPEIVELCAVSRSLGELEGRHHQDEERGHPFAAMCRCPAGLRMRDLRIRQAELLAEFRAQEACDE